MSEHPLKIWRTSQDLKVREVADLLGVRPSNWSRWENSVRPVPAVRVPKVAEVTGVDAHILRPDLPDLFPAPQEQANG